MGITTDWYDEDPDNRGDCELCGERYDYLDRRPSFSEVGEFVRKRTESDAEGSVEIIEHVIAHAQCGIDHELELA